MADQRTRAFERVYRAEYPRVVSFCLRRVDDYELSRDIAAEVFRIAWSRWDEPRDSVRAWLLGIARNRIGDEYRRRRRTPTGRIQIDIPDARSDAGFERADVRTALAKLTADQREVLLLHYWDGLSASEAAAILGVSVGAVWMRLSRARREFAAIWDDAPSTITQPEGTDA